MIFDYNNQPCEITVTPVGVTDGFYILRVETAFQNKKEVWKEAVPVQTLRNRADANGTEIQEERDAFVDEAITRAQDRFKDIVDIEALNDGRI